MVKTGRNDLCPCGSGRKYKRCCQGKTPGARSSKVLLIIVGAAMLAAVAAGVASFTTERSSTTRVWDPVHGHYHDATGTAVP
ncbi:MAG TPA: SEC-C metal-binding domain-containing protein [Vicinamibacterales bacterium]|nr:SEC-C metal-binding domain-containing protein [Vicinamibacterales bacterium]